MESNTKIVDEINKEETFKEAKDIKLDPNAVFVEFNSTIALEKLLNIKKLTMAEKLNLIILRPIPYLKLDFPTQSIWGNYWRQLVMNC